MMTDSTDSNRTLTALAANLKSRRMLRALTQQRLAEDASTSVFTVRALERARGSNPSLLKTRLFFLGFLGP